MKTSNSRPSKRDPTDGLTQAERIFCYNFLLTGSQRKSAHKAWSCKNDTIADDVGYTAMQKPHICAFLARLRKEAQGSAKEVCEQAKRVIDELAILSFSDPKDYVDALGLPDAVKEAIKKMGPESRAISEIEVEETGSEVKTRKVKFKFHSKTTALTLLGKHHTLYTELVKWTGDSIAPQTYQLPDNGMKAKKDA